MTTFEIERLEPNSQKKEVFFSIKVNYETSVFTYGKWLSASDVTAYFEDPTTIRSIIETNYLNEAIQFFLNNPPAGLWHDETCLIQIIQSKDDCIKMMRLHGELAIIKRDMGIQDYEEYGNVYTYLNFLYDIHKGWIEDPIEHRWNAQIEVRPGYHLELNEGVWIAVKD